MPNHLHMIVRISAVRDDGNRPAVTQTLYAAPWADCAAARADCHPPLRKSIPNMVQGLKGAVAREIGFSLWQRSYHDHIVRDEDDYQKVWRYIEENPAKWAEDKFYCDNGDI